MIGTQATTPDDKAETQRKTIIKLAILFVSTIIFVGVYLFVGYQQNIPSLQTVAWILAGFSLLVLVSIFLVSKGRTDLGMWLTLVGMFIIWPISVSIAGGLGLVLAASLPLIVILFTTGVLPKRQISLATIIAFGIGILTLLIDISGSGAQEGVPEAIQTFLPVMVVAIVIVYGILIFRNFNNYSMRAKLITATAALAIISILVVTITVSLTTRNAISEQVGDNLQSLTQAQALTLGELLSKQVNALEAVGLNTAVLNAVDARNQSFYVGNVPEDIQVNIAQLSEQWAEADDTDRLVLSVLNNSTSRELRTFQETFSDHTRLVLLDSNGAVIAATERPEKFVFNDEPWWIDFPFSSFATINISEPYIDEETGQIHIDIIVPVEKENVAGNVEITGILLSSLNLAILADVLEQGQVGDTGRLELHFANHQELVFRDGQVGLDTVPMPESEIVDTLTATETEFAIDEYLGTVSLISQAPITTLDKVAFAERLGWRIVGLQPEAEALQPVLNLQRINIILGVVIVVAASITAAVVAQLLTGPISRLTDTAVRVAEGDFTARAPVESTDEIGTLATAFNQMTDQLQHAITGLEANVAERTRALSASVEISRSLSTILDPDLLIVEIVEQVRNAFDYYYVQIYLFDENKRILHMMGGTGETGQNMISLGHQLRAGQGLVGQAAATNNPIFIADVFQSSGWQANTLLPDTKTEIAVPIAIGDEVLGVLDVQHDVTGGLTEGDIGLLQSVASQVAIAIRNASSFEQAKKQAERETLLNEINQRIQQAPSVDAVLQIAAAELGRALGGQATWVQLHNPVHGKNGNNHEEQGK